MVSIGYRIRQNFRGGKLSRLCTKHTIHWKTFAVHQAHAINYCTQQMIQGENFRDWLKNREKHESFAIYGILNVLHYIQCSMSHLGVKSKISELRMGSKTLIMVQHHMFKIACNCNHSLPRCQTVCTTLCKKDCKCITNVTLGDKLIDWTSCSRANMLL